MSEAAQPPAIVLVRPQLGQNIGKAARAMLNFGLTELRLVEPRDGWPNPSAGPAAAGADVVLERATVHETLAEAALWADQVICGWGSHGAHLGRGVEVEAILRATGRPLFHLGLTLAGAPKHPLYVGYAVQPQLWA